MGGGGAVLASYYVGVPYLVSAATMRIFDSQPDYDGEACRCLKLVTADRLGI